jgi:urease beta subunit
MDAIVWDIVDMYTYPTTAAPLRTGLFTVTPVKALYCNVQFANTTTVENNIRLQTLLTDGSNPRVLSGDVIDVCINNQPISVTLDGGIDISNVTVINTGANPVCISGNVHLTDQSINVNVVNTGVKPVCISGNVHLTDQSINVNVVNTGANPVQVQFQETAMDKVWESSTEFNTQVNGGAARIFTINATNFAPDYRYVKLYDSVTAPNITVKPRITIPLPPDLPQNIQLGSKGLRFAQGIYVRITRLYAPNDQNMSTAGDVGLTVIFEAP